MICKKCGNKISNGSKFCYKCGNKTSDGDSNTISTTNKNVCRNCGNKVTPDSAFCKKCGHNLSGTNSSNVNNNVVTNSTVSNDLKISIDKNNVKNDNLSINATEMSTANDNLNINKTDNISVESNTQNSSNSEVSNIPNECVRQQNNYSKNINTPVKKNKNKTFKIIFILVAIGAFGNIINALSDIATETSQNPTTNNEETVQTKVFTDTEENIAFRYPENWKDTTFSTEEFSPIVSLTSPVYNNSTANMQIYKVDVNITSEFLNNNFTDYKAFLAELYSQKDFEVQEIVDTKIDGVKAIKFTGTFVDESTVIQYYYNANESIYSITFTTLTENLDKDEPIFDSIMDSYSTTGEIKSRFQKQDIGENGLTEEQALEVAQDFVDTYSLYDRTITGKVEYEPEDYEYSTKGLYLVETLTPEALQRSIWVDKKTGDILLSADGITLKDAEEVYEEMFVSNKESDEILFN